MLNRRYKFKKNATKKAFADYVGSENIDRLVIISVDIPLNERQVIISRP